LHTVERSWLQKLQLREYAPAGRARIWMMNRIEARFVWQAVPQALVGWL
jgi:hypothetical protein